jgi:predicted RNase H-like HicB family nuclease
VEEKMTSEALWLTYENTQGTFLSGECARSRETRPTQHEFNIIIERDEEGYYVASVPELRGCHTQAKLPDMLMKRVREAIDLCLEVEGHRPKSSQFVGVQRMLVKT